MPIEGMNNNESSSEGFSKFEKRVDETSKFFAGKISEYKNVSKFPDSFDQYIDGIHAESATCLVFVRDQYDLFVKELGSNTEEYKKNVGPLFNAPLELMDAKMEEVKIILDNKPFDVMEAKDRELTASIEALQKEFGENNPGLTERLNDIKKKIEDSFVAVYEASHEISEKLRTHWSEFNMQQTENVAQNIDTAYSGFETMMKKIRVEYCGRHFAILDTYTHNCADIVDKARKQFESEWPGLN